MVQVKTTARPGNSNQFGRDDYNLRTGDRATTKPIEDEIRARAFEIYVQRGRAPGRESDDWAQAEREIKERRRTQ